MIYIPIGNTCNTAEELKKHNLRHHSYPFDWLFTSLEVIEDCIKDRFKFFLDKDYYYDINDERCKHSYYQNMIRTESLVKLHKECSFCRYPDDYEWHLFNHHNLTNVNIYSAFERRCDRFLNDLDNNECCFVYMNEILDDTDDIVKFYENTIEGNDKLRVIGLIKGDSNQLKYIDKNLKIYTYTNSSYIHEILVGSVGRADGVGGQ